MGCPKYAPTKNLGVDILGLSMLPPFSVFFLLSGSSKLSTDTSVDCCVCFILSVNARGKFFYSLAKGEELIHFQAYVVSG